MFHLNFRALDKKFVLLALAWMAVIFVFSSQPKSDIPTFGVWDTLIKKAGHMLEYAILAWLWYRALGRLHGWAAWGITALYAASDEFHQSFTPGRHAQIADVIIDAAGAALGLWVAWRLDRRLELALKTLIQQIIALLG